MAPPAPEVSRGRFGLRLLSAVAIAVPAFAAIHFGFPFFDLLVATAGAVMAWEWVSMCRQGRFDPVAGWPLVFGTLAVVALGAMGEHVLALIAVAFSALLAYGMALSSRRENAGLIGLGAIYVTLPCMAISWLRYEPDNGREIVIWIVATVVATDIGAYIVGRAVGGPRLAPRISPKKTWAGLIGGIACAAMMGVAAALLLGLPQIVRLGGISAALAVVAQGGDLLESAAKRHFGVKDMGSIIPGHGGVFDRVDGLIAAVVAIWAVDLAWGGDGLPWR